MRVKDPLRRLIAGLLYRGYLSSVKWIRYRRGHQAGMFGLLRELPGSTAAAATLLIRFATLWFGVLLGPIAWIFSRDPLRREEADRPIKLRSDVDATTPTDFKPTLLKVYPALYVYWLSAQCRGWSIV